MSAALWGFEPSRRGLEACMDQRRAGRSRFHGALKRTDAGKLQNYRKTAENGLEKTAAAAPALTKRDKA